MPCSNDKLAEALKEKRSSLIGPDLIGLQYSLEKRTTGLDGYPLR